MIGWVKQLEWKDAFEQAGACGEERKDEPKAHAGEATSVSAIWDFLKIKVTLNPLSRTFSNFAESLMVVCSSSNNNKWRSPTSFWSYEHLKPIKHVFHWNSHCHGKRLQQDNKQNLFSNNSSFKWLLLITPLKGNSGRVVKSSQL